MQVLIIDLFFALFAVAIGAAGTWWLCFRHLRARNRGKKGAEGREAQEVLARLRGLATRVAIDVDEHRSRVEEINEELTSTDDHEAAAIVDVVAKLVKANQQMQSRLASTENKLHEQAQQIESNAADARTDALTLLANRRAFDAEMARRISEFQRHGRVFSLVMIDVDHFKRFNDTHGHQAGDEVLRGIGRVLRRKTREMDLVARYGGEEFAVILPGTVTDEACQTAMRNRETLERSCFMFDDKELRVTASFGVAQVLPDEDGAGLLRRADEALYASKEAGRNCIHWHDGQRTHHVGCAQEADSQEACDEVQREAQPSATAGSPPVSETTEGKNREISPPPEVSEPQPVTSNPVAMDMLSELESRSAFCQHVRNRVAEWKRGGATVSVLLAEIDQYDQLSRHENREVAEAATRATTISIVSAVREMDLAAQYSPGCVGLLLPGAELADAMHAAERLRKAVSQCAVQAGSDQIRITVSVSVVEVANSEGPVELLRRAESALTAGRNHGGNCSYYHDGERCAPITTMLEAMDHLA